jgi:hypothetical protein
VGLPDFTLGSYCDHDNHLPRRWYFAHGSTPLLTGRDRRIPGYLQTSYCGFSRAHSDLSPQSSPHVRRFPPSVSACVDLATKSSRCRSARREPTCYSRADTESRRWSPSILAAHPGAIAGADDEKKARRTRRIIRRITRVTRIRITARALRVRASVPLTTRHSSGVRRIALRWRMLHPQRRRRLRVRSCAVRLSHCFYVPSTAPTCLSNQTGKMAQAH